jgi:hypothetical protein
MDRHEPGGKNPYGTYGKGSNSLSLGDALKAGRKEVKKKKDKEMREERRYTHTTQITCRRK